MENLISNIKSIDIYSIQDRLKKEKIFVIAFLLAIATCFFVKPQLSYINFKVLALLFNLMIIVSAFENLKVMDKIALGILSKCSNTRIVSLVFILLAFFSSMLVTNDVALLTFVPLCIFTFKKIDVDSMTTIILQTLAANIGSSLTPMGNPQNLFLFTHYKLSGFQFFSVTIPLVALGMVWLLFLNKKVTKENFEFSLNAISIKDKLRTSIYSVLFLLIVLSVFNLIDYRYILLAAVVCVLFMDKQLIKQVDYFLLGTFVCFFIFIGNISSIEIIQQSLRHFLQRPAMPYFSSIVLSQVISNVPCSILISRFTTNWREVLLGVNIGGMGTIIASLASLISYKIYVNENEEKSKIYMKKFYKYNFISLLLFTLINYFFI